MMRFGGSLLAQAGGAADGVGVSSVLEFAQRGGLMMIPIGLCSLIVVAVAVERASVLRRGRILPRNFRKGLDQAMDRAGDEGGSLEEVVAAGRAYCKKRMSPAARLILAGLEKMGHAPEIVEKHMAAAGEDEVFLMRRRLRSLVVIAAIAPLLGLTGTIFGMIKAFQTVATSAEALGKTELLAEGIYEAMVTTAAGLLVAIPTVIIYHWLSGKIERFARDLDRLGVSFIETRVLEPAELSAPARSPNGALTGTY